MNGYCLLAESYRKLAKEGKIDQKTADDEARVLDFLATCDNMDMCRMVDSSAFNDIIRAYVQLAMKDAGLSKKDREKVQVEMKYIFDRYSASEVLKKCGYPV